MKEPGTHTPFSIVASYAMSSAPSLLLFKLTGNSDQFRLELARFLKLWPASIAAACFSALRYDRFD